MTTLAQADTRWIADFQSRYAAWWPGAAPLIEQHDYASVITTPGGHIELPYRWETSPVMWRGKPLSEGSDS